MEKCNTEELYILHRSRLLSLIQAKVEDAQKAEDLLHDSFIKLQTCCESDCECERPKSYLFRMVLNTVFDYFKKRKKNQTPQLDYMQQEVGMNAENEKSQCDLIQCIGGFLEETSLENRIAFENVDVLQKPQVKVAQELNIPLPTLKSRVQRTRKYLRERIEECCPDYQSTCV